MEVVIIIEPHQLTSGHGSRQNDPNLAIWPAMPGCVAWSPNNSGTIGLPSKSRVSLKPSLARILLCASRTRRYTEVCSSKRAAP